MRWLIAAIVLAGLAACERSPDRSQTTYEVEARKTVEAWAADVRGGGSGARFWLHREEAEKLFAVRSCQVLSVHAVDADGVDVVARVESSNRAGLAITADWTFFLSRAPSRTGGSGGEWKIEFLAAHE